MQFPILFVLLCIQRDSPGWPVVYPLMLLPTTAPCLLMMKYATNEDVSDQFNVFDTSNINEGVVWFVLVASIPFWFCMYLYLDQVIPSEYGITKHPCFCCRKKKDTAQTQLDGQTFARLSE